MAFTGSKKNEAEVGINERSPRKNKVGKYKKNTDEYELGFMIFLVREALTFRQEKNIREHYGGLGNKYAVEGNSGNQLWQAWFYHHLTLAYIL